MKNPENDFARYLSSFLTSHLSSGLGTSTHTVAAYRDTFRLLLLFWEKEKGVRPERLRLSMLTRDSVVAFLDWIETDRKCSVSTRNLRLAALHSFFRFVSRENPENLFETQRILTIPSKKHPRPDIAFLTLRETEVLLAQPDRSTKSGRRDLVLLALLYDSAARVQELVDLTRSDIRLDDPAVVHLRGKGRKSRTVPIMSKTRQLLADHLENPRTSTRYAQPDAPVFCNQRREKLTRRGVLYILMKHVEKARTQPEFRNVRKVTCHVLRHSRASHMVQAGIPLVYIRDFLGHVSVTSTEIYARLDAESKRKAMENAYLDLNVDATPAWENDNDLMNWLADLCK
jgi:site-specific recombinase XerD